ncbi:serine--tRNA ligase [Candidatus Woesearchaeota archaeon]|nr:MAG: serine--tRNA ligase [Candidatus Woesearchaeota archaeon]
MLDINYIRKYPEVVRENLKRRKVPEYLTFLDNALELDSKWRELKREVDALRARRNALSQDINKAKKEGADATTLIQEASKLPKKLEEREAELSDLQEKLKLCLYNIPNLVHDSVPYGKDDTENEVVKVVGEKPAYKFKPKSHVDLLELWKLADIKRAAKISGARWAFLKGKLVILEQALINYAIDFLSKKGFEPITPPHMMLKTAYEGVTSLEDFESVMYKIAGEDLYAIATSEHPLTAMWNNEVLTESELPIKLAGYSMCFRKEAGTHGKDTKGIFRVHQFNKVEQLIVCKPEESWDLHEELLENAAEFFESLGLHFRIVNICTGDLGMVAAKKYDIEAWYPVQNAYREVVSCSNCTSYQAVRSNIRYEHEGKREYVHTLNSTCVATTRALAAIMENFQDERGVIHIPQALQKYTGFKTIGGEE